MAKCGRSYEPKLCFHSIVFVQDLNHMFEATLHYVQLVSLVVKVALGLRIECTLQYLRTVAKAIESLSSCSLCCTSKFHSDCISFSHGGCVCKVTEQTAQDLNIGCGKRREFSPTEENIEHGSSMMLLAQA